MIPEQLKLIVKEKYGGIADQEQSSCCDGPGCCEEVDYTTFSDDYSKLEGYNPEADLSLGCGIPTEYAGIKKGDHVLDLGSGAGNDCFVARSFVGEHGTITGLDFTDEMLRKANSNLEKTGYKNIKFVKGDIENIPLKDNQFDVVISNCVLNLVPDKEKAFSEVFRVLKPGGRFCISDVVLNGVLPGKLKEEAAMYTNCISGALQKNEYLDIIRKSGFSNIEVKKESEKSIPDEILEKHLNPGEIEDFKTNAIGIYSITVVGQK